MSTLTGFDPFAPDVVAALHEPSTYSSADSMILRRFTTFPPALP